MILVTGATGTVGREIVAQLVDRGLRARVLTRTQQRRRRHHPRSR